MITLGTVKFDFLTDNEPFAQWLNGRWETFYATSFERVADEVLSAYDTPERVITIDSLSLDMGTLPEDDFERHFALRLRESLEAYMDKWIGTDRSVALSAGIRMETVGHAALDLLSFYLLHGYLPSYTDKQYTDLHFLLSKVVSESAYPFRAFLESYAHYDFLCRRLVFSFTDDELQEIVRVVQPSESKFVNLYVQVQLRSYASLRRPDIAKNDYRNVVWTLVLAYLFAESRTRFSRKQMMMHTLRGVAAHFNFTFAEMARLMTEGVLRLEPTVGQLPELWSLLKEIRQDVQRELHLLDGDYRRHLLRELLFALQHDDKGDASFLLSCQHVCYVLSDPSSCRELLSQLHEPQIHHLVGILVPSEKEYVVTYARFLDKNKDAGTFTGKAGSEFRLLKWEFIFAVLLLMPASAFSRRQFVLSVLQRLASHYNLSVSELIHLLASQEGWDGVGASHLLAVLRLLDSELHLPTGEPKPWEALSFAECEAVLHTPRQLRLFVTQHTERQMVTLLARWMPAYSEFIAGYATLLDKGQDVGAFEGKAGGEFRLLKWEFILSCLFIDKGGIFNQKFFVYSVLQRLAAHYNQEVTGLLLFLLRELSTVLAQLPFASLRGVFQELYDEVAVPLDRARDKEPTQWVLTLFGVNASPQLVGREAYLEKWLVYFLNEQRELFRTLWRAGRLNIPFLLMLAGRTPALRSLWLHRIGDQRLLTLYRHWQAVYKALSSRFQEYGFLKPASEYLSVWMVELTSRGYSAWSEREIIRFLTARLRRTIPPGLESLLDKIQPQMNKKLTEIIQYIDELKKEEIMMDFREEAGQVEVHNAGITLLNPYLPMLFHRLGYLNTEHKGFKDEDSQIRAVFVLQYLVYGEQREYSELDLFLNKILVGLTDYIRPLPRKIELDEKEKEMVDNLLEAACQNWEKMSRTSMLAFRISFLQRKGVVSYTENVWNVRVEEKGYDILLDSVPWGFKIFMAPWMKNRIVVKWR